MKRHTDGIKMFMPRNRTSWRDWLEKHHESEKSVWLVYKKGPGPKRNITYPEAVEEALCFGWIDSKPNKLDETRTIQYFSQRNPKSYWSSLNKQRVSRLIKEKQMHSAGMRMIRIAKQTGTWSAMDEVEKMIMPEDLVLAFQRDPEAAKNYDSFPASVKRGILGWIQSAKRTETRLKRIEETVRLAAENIRANQYTRKDR